MALANKKSKNNGKIVLVDINISFLLLQFIKPKVLAIWSIGH
jgi:hypothetical protein